MKMNLQIYVLVALCVMLSTPSTMAAETEIQARSRALLTERAQLRGRKLNFWKKLGKAVSTATKSVASAAKSSVQIVKGTATQIADSFEDIFDKEDWSSSDSTSNLLEAYQMLALSAQSYFDSPYSSMCSGAFKLLDSYTYQSSTAAVYQHTTSGKCVVAYRGTADTQDAVTDLAMQAPSAVTRNGFKMSSATYYYWYRLQSRVDATLAGAGCTASNTICTGHSLGGGAAAVGQAMGTCSKSITWAAPRVFYSGCSSTFKANARRYYLSMYATTSGMTVGGIDPIPSLPVGLSHCAGTNVELGIFVSDSSSTLISPKNRVAEMSEPSSGTMVTAHFKSNIETWFTAKGYAFCAV